MLVKSRETPKESLKALEQEEEKVAPEVVKFTDTTVRDESSIEISSQIQQQLMDMPKPSTEAAESSSNHDTVLLPGEPSVSPEPADFQLPEDVDIDIDFFNMIEDELNGKSLEDDIESGKGVCKFYVKFKWKTIFASLHI